MILISRFLKKLRICSNLDRTETKIRRYLRSGRKPWAEGYKEYKERILNDVLNDQSILDIFLNNKELPSDHGYRLDERVIEFPWVISRLDVSEKMLLDAGSALNFQYILNLAAMKNKKVVIYTLSPEGTSMKRSNISYIYGDLRDTILKSEYFDEIVCISTLEHIGMDNTMLYSKDKAFNESKRDDYLLVVEELYRLLKSGGKLLLTVPYGLYENHGWLQQFDHSMIERVLKTFNGSHEEVTYYRYFDEGWQKAESDECTSCRYFDIHNAESYELDYAAAARSVACMELVK